MLFNTYEFLLGFLPAALLIYWFADRSERWRTWVLIGLSLAFYSYWDLRFLPIMIGSILLNWSAAKLYAATRRNGVIAAAIAANLLALGFFKYTNFIAENCLALFGVTSARFDIVLPLGISFFTFHHIMYLVDQRGGRAPVYRLDKYALYTCFFPQAISGPIARWSEVIHQFGKTAFGPGWQQRCALGSAFIVIGLLQKVLIADPLAAALDPIYADALVGPVTDGRSWMALGFAFQIFLDFAAYSDIAIGLGLVFGVELPLNFDGPLRAVSITELWRRWHMTLSRFLRDYVYVPLGGSRHGMPQQVAALLITMALCGLWHGAGWNFVLWGFLQGVALVAALAWRKFCPPLPSVVGWALTIGFFVGTMVIFRAGSLAAVWHVYEGLTVSPAAHLAGRNTLLAAMVWAIVLPPSHKMCRWLTETPRFSVAVGLAAALSLILVVIGRRESYQFIYFQF